MPSIEQIVQRARLELGNLMEPFYYRFTGSGDGTRFDMKGIENVESAYLYELGDPENPLIEGEDYRIESSSGMVIFTNPPEMGRPFVVEGERARYFSDDEMRLFVSSAFDMHTRSRNPRPTYQSLPPSEVLLVAILAQIEALWVLKASAAYDINVHAPEGMFIPRAQRFEQLSRMLQDADQRYRDLAASMGVGLYAIEMFNLRRVSRTTGRYVATYIDREWDDTRPPQRVEPNIDTQFTELPQSGIEVHDLNIVQGRKFSKTFEMLEDDESFNFDENEEFEVRLFRTQFGIHLHHHEVLPQFTLETNDETNEVTISMAAEDTKRLQSTGSYRWTLTWVLTDERIPLLEGKVLVAGTYPRKSVNIRVAQPK